MWSMKRGRYCDPGLLAGDAMAMYVFPCLAAVFAFWLTKGCQFLLYWREVSESTFVSIVAATIVLLTAYEVGAETPNLRTSFIDLLKYMGSFIGVIVFSEVVWLMLYYVSSVIPTSDHGLWTPSAHDFVGYLAADFAFWRFVLHTFYTLPPIEPTKDKVKRGRGLEDGDDVQARALRDV